MAFRTYKKGLKPIEDQAIENGRELFWRTKYPFNWKRRGSWRQLPPRKHPGWAAYHENKDTRQS